MSLENIVKSDWAFERIFEVAKTGNYTISICYSKQLEFELHRIKQLIPLYEKFYNIKFVINGDLTYELTDVKYHLNWRKYDDINLSDTLNRINAYKQNKLRNNALDTSSMLLLNRSIEKLGFGVEEIQLIYKTSQTIAQIANQDISIEHVAEAIQYQKLKVDSWNENEMIWHHTPIYHKVDGVLKAVFYDQDLYNQFLDNNK